MVLYRSPIKSNFKELILTVGARLDSARSWGSPFMDGGYSPNPRSGFAVEIGRASCRERV